jgi:hypothetical protein
MDPDPEHSSYGSGSGNKSSGSLRIRLRIHNTDIFSNKKFQKKLAENLLRKKNCYDSHQIIASEWVKTMYHKKKLE